MGTVKVMTGAMARAVDVERALRFSLPLSLSIYIYVYIYISFSLNIYIYLSILSVSQDWRI